MSDETKKSLRCSFCGKREEEVRRMIQAPGARICDQCVQLCMSVLEEELGRKETEILYAREGSQMFYGKVREEAE